MPFTSSRLLLTKETYYYLQANANKGHQETLSSQTLNAGMVEGLIICRLLANKRNANQRGLPPELETQKEPQLSDSPKQDSAWLSKDVQHLHRKTAATVS